MTAPSPDTGAWDAGGTRPSYGHGVVRSYLLRLVPELLAEGDYVGWIEEIGVGERTPFHDLEEMTKLLRGPSPIGSLGGAEVRCST